MRRGPAPSSPRRFMVPNWRVPAKRAVSSAWSPEAMRRASSSRVSGSGSSASHAWAWAVRASCSTVGRPLSVGLLSGSHAGGAPAGGGSVRWGVRSDAPAVRWGCGSDACGGAVGVVVGCLRRRVAVRWGGRSAYGGGWCGAAAGVDVLGLARSGRLVREGADAPAAAGAHPHPVPSRRGRQHRHRWRAAAMPLAAGSRAAGAARVGAAAPRWRRGAPTPPAHTNAGRVATHLAEGTRTRAAQPRLQRNPGPHGRAHKSRRAASTWVTDAPAPG